MPEIDAIKSYTRLAKLEHGRGEAEQALQHLANALRLARECGLKKHEAGARKVMQKIYAGSGRPDLAECCRRAVPGV